MRIPTWSTVPDAIRYAVVAGSLIPLDVCIYMIGVACGLNPIAAAAIPFAVTGPAAYMACRTWVWHGQPGWSEALWFIVVGIGGWLITMAGVGILVAYGCTPFIARVGAAVVCFAHNFLWRRWLLHRQRAIRIHSTDLAGCPDA